MRQQLILRFALLLAVCGGLTVLWLGAWVVGVTPASIEEREFIDMARHSALASDARLSAALQVADSANYLARRNFFAVADAVAPGLPVY